jgi:hypothetical protein
MSRGGWPLSRRQRRLSIPMSGLVWMGYRRWLVRPWQCSLRDYLVIVALCAAALLVRGLPTPVIIFFAILGAAVYTCLRLARHGFKLAEIATLLAIILLIAAFLLPAMERTSRRTMGYQFFPTLVPAWYKSLISGAE